MTRSELLRRFDLAELDGTVQELIRSLPFRDHYELAEAIAERKREGGRPYALANP